MKKAKCCVSFEKRGLVSAEDRVKYKKIVTKTVNSVLESECAAVISSGCDEKNLDGFEVNIMFTDEESIRAINNEYRQIDKSTDVLSFPINDFLYGEGEISICNLNEEFDRLLLGDIVVSVPTMSRQAEEYGHGIERECAFLVCHGMLHLLGYDHMNQKDEKQMFGYAEEILETAGYVRS